MDLNWLTITEAHKGLREKKFSAVELLDDCLSQAEKVRDLNTFITLTPESARAQAGKVDKKIAGGEEISILEGTPGAIKDLLCTRGVKTTCASKMLENFVPPYSATVVDKLERAGFVDIGKTNLDEYACGASTEHSCFGPTLNPWDKRCVAGGSSGGSAVAVASGQSLFAIGTDTGGSIRQPASLSGCVGLKPTYGRVSRSGVNAMASSWDTVGPFARTASDAAIVLNLIAGADPLDATTPPVAVPDYTANLSKGVAGLRIGVPKEFFGEGVTKEVSDTVWAAIREYEKMGATVREISLPSTKYGVAVYYVTMPTELSTNLARFDGIRFGHKPEEEIENLYGYYTEARGEGFGAEIKRRIMVGTFVSSAGYVDAYYKKAQKVRTLIIRDFEKAFLDCDVIMAPASPFPAFRVGEKASDPLAMYLADVHTIPASAAGIPSISLPCGFSGMAGSGVACDAGAARGLPIGLQIMGPQFAEGLILQVAAAYEQATEWHKMRPGE
ncbi:MAG: Asp-tRNA(Asn)/Glu-tRNA(Gln) amidotransferase subunit GatA [Candidatus Gracilibacteria bacterium]|jgi:aspartyl-tRNA(Asn)/glutamyl-tRNA(Gln) amidotransferase subunit A